MAIVKKIKLTLIKYKESYSLPDIDLRNYVRDLKPGEYIIYISNKKPTRTTSQNKYLWGVVYKTIADEIGEHVNDVHELMKHKFGEQKGLRIKDKWGHGFRASIPKSTTDYDTKEFSEYIENIRRWSLDFLNCRIPEANEIPDEYLIK